MTALINPGSHIGASTGKAWTNTFEEAKKTAERWLESMHNDDGLTDVELVRCDPLEHEGRWSFYFRHKVTGVEVELDTHGISDVDAYCAKYIFTPRIYWNGSSTGDPKIEDFKAPGFRVHKTFVPSNKEPSNG